MPKRRNKETQDDNWGNSLLGDSNRNYHVANNVKVDSVYKQTTGSRPSFDFISEDEYNPAEMQRRTNLKANDRVRAAKYLEKQNNLYLGNKGMTKIANTQGSVSDIGVSTVDDFYSPWLSTDYLELPRSYAEERRWYRFFYDQDPLVGRAVDLKTFIPLSKMSLGLPRCRSHKLSQKVHTFYENMWQNLRMFEKVQWILHEYNLIGEVLVYFEWDDEDNTWSKILILDPDLCEVRYMPFADETRVFLRPDHSIKEVVEDLKERDRYSDFANTLEEISDDALMNSENTFIELNTDPRKGSFVKYFGRRRSPYRPGPGVSVLRRVLRTLLFRDKIRQALTQITSRHMTPVRIVWAEGLGPDEVNALRDQVDYAVMGPDFSIVTNYELNWEEITAEGRLFDASAVLDQTTEELLIGLGVTKELLLGEGSYGGGRITLQVLDTEYSLVRELLQEMMNEVFRVAAEKNDFIEEEPQSGLRYVVYSTLKFSRMALRDYADVFDFFFNMYQNGTLDKETLLEFFNIDPIDVETKLKQNFLTISDNLADELRRNVYGAAAEMLFQETDVVDRLIDGFGLTRTKEFEDQATMSESSPEDMVGGMETSVPGIPGEGEDAYLEAPAAEEEVPVEEESLENPMEDLDKELGEYHEPGIYEPDDSPRDFSKLKGVKLPKAPAGPSGPIK